jgi:hypothetical protein
MWWAWDDGRTMSDPSAPPRRARHLIDPANPPRPAPPASTTRVQQWVMSALVVTTIMHLSVGLLFAAAAIDDNLTSQVGLDVISGVLGMLAVGAGRAIHRRSPLSPWLLGGFTPGLVGLLITLT